MLREEGKTTGPELILIGTGSEVSTCIEAAEALEGEGIATRVVSMPCYDRFLEQDEAYRDSVLPPACRARVSLEAAATFGWERWVTEDGESLGMHGFGASAPAKDLYPHFGLTPSTWCRRARRSSSASGAAARS